MRNAKDIVCVYTLIYIYIINIYIYMRVCVCAHAQMCVYIYAYLERQVATNESLWGSGVVSGNPNSFSFGTPTYTQPGI